MSYGFMFVHSDFIVRDSSFPSRFTLACEQALGGEGGRWGGGGGRGETGSTGWLELESERVLRSRYGWIYQNSFRG